MEDLHCWQDKFVSCKYSEQLLNKIVLLNQQPANYARNQVNITQIKKAIYYAKKYHAHQTRDSGEPFYSHPLAVATMVADYCFKTDILVTSILHDTIEDTSLDKQTISYIFDDNIAEQVDNLTRIQLNTTISCKQLLKSLWQNNNQDILIVKLLDRLHNMQTISSKSPTKQLATTKETLVEFGILSIMLKFNNPGNVLFNNLDQELLNICYKNLFNTIPLTNQEHQFLQNAYQDSYLLPSLSFHNENTQTKTQ
jgi:(p)ppGpp synthase/HD superfamily hydrolase